jgi:hypothetical protein
MTTTALSIREIPERFFKGQDELKGPLPPELLAPSYRAELVGVPPMDAEDHSMFSRAFYTAFPDLTHTLDEVLETESGVAVRFTIRGTNTGSFMGIPATNMPITVSAVVLMTVVGGQVTHLRGIFDQLGLLRQLGVIQA